MSLLDVGAHVKLQFEGLGESFSTHVARARPLFGMGASHVTVMCCVWRESLSTMLALQWEETSSIIMIWWVNRSNWTIMVHGRGDDDDDHDYGGWWWYQKWIVWGVIHCAKKQKAEEETGWYWSQKSKYCNNNINNENDNNNHKRRMILESRLCHYIIIKVSHTERHSFKRECLHFPMISTARLFSSVWSVLERLAPWLIISVSVPSPNPTAL